MTVKPATYPIVNLFRAFAIESYVTGRPLLSGLLLAYSGLIVMTCTALSYFVFVVVRLFDTNDNVIVNVISAMLAGGLFFTTISITVHSMCRRRQFADMLLAVQRMDEAGARHEFDWYVPRRHMATKYSVVLATFALAISSTAFFYYSVIHSWKIAFVIFVSMVMRVRCLQIVFYVHQLHARLLLLNAELRRGLAELRVAAAANETAAPPTPAANGDWFNTVGRTYDELWELCRMINECFGWSLLALTSDASMVAVVYCFLVFVQRFYRSAFGLLPTLATFAVICWTCDECVQSVRLCVDIFGSNAI